MRTRIEATEAESSMESLSNAGRGGWVLAGVAATLAAFAALPWARSLAPKEPEQAAVEAPPQIPNPAQTTNEAPDEVAQVNREPAITPSELHDLDPSPVVAEHAEPRPETPRDLRAARNAYLAEILEVIRTECTEADFVQALQTAQDRAPISPIGGLSAREMSEAYFVTTLVLGEQFITYFSEHNCVEGIKANMRERLAGNPNQLRLETRHFNSSVAALSGVFAMLPDFAKHIAAGTIGIKIDRPNVGQTFDGWDPRRIGVSTVESFSNRPDKKYIGFFWQSGPWRVCARISDPVWTESVLHAVRNPPDH